MTEFCVKNQIDLVMLSETNGKWTTRTTDATSSKMKVLGRETRCYYSDSKAHKTRDSDWLQGRLMNVTTCKTSGLIQHQQEKQTSQADGWLSEHQMKKDINHDDIAQKTIRHKSRCLDVNFASQSNERENEVSNQTQKRHIERSN